MFKRQVESMFHMAEPAFMHGHAQAWGEMCYGTPVLQTEGEKDGKCVEAKARQVKG
jgi:hypothetical protein